MIACFKTFCLLRMSMFLHCHKIFVFGMLKICSLLCSDWLFAAFLSS